MTVFDSVMSLPEHEAKKLLLSLLANSFGVIETARTGGDTKHAIACLAVVAGRHGLLQQMKNESAAFDPRKEAQK